MEKIIKYFKEGLEMFAKSNYGDVNRKYKEMDIEEQHTLKISKSNSKHNKTKGHLRLIK
jgi:hypothetical protein